MCRRRGFCFLGVCIYSVVEWLQMDILLSEVSGELILVWFIMVLYEEVNDVSFYFGYLYFFYKD